MEAVCGAGKPPESAGIIQSVLILHPDIHTSGSVDIKVMGAVAGGVNPYRLLGITAFDIQTGIALQVDIARMDRGRRVAFWDSHIDPHRGSLANIQIRGKDTLGVVHESCGFVVCADRQRGIAIIVGALDTEANGIADGLVAFCCAAAGKPSIVLLIIGHRPCPGGEHAVAVQLNVNVVSRGAATPLDIGNGLRVKGFQDQRPFFHRKCMGLGLYVAAPLHRWYRRSDRLPRCCCCGR